jgi:hypothetical protein
MQCLLFFQLLPAAAFQRLDDHLAVCVLQKCGDLEIFSVVTGCISLLVVVFLIVIVAHLSISLHK